MFCFFKQSLVCWDLEYFQIQNQVLGPQLRCLIFTASLIFISGPEWKLADPGLLPLPSGSEAGAAPCGRVIACIECTGV